MRERIPTRGGPWRSRLLLLLMAGVPWLFLSEPHATWRCAACGSTRTESQWRVGPTRGDSLPLSPLRSTVQSTDAAAILLGANHRHSWTFAQGSDGFKVLGWGVI